MLICSGRRGAMVRLEPTTGSTPSDTSTVYWLLILEMRPDLALKSSIFKVPLEP
jgi:P pilus assembly chaperone PapD